MNFSSTPGSGRPMTPGSSSCQFTKAAAGAVSVLPQLVVSHSGSSRTLAHAATRRCQVVTGMPAPA